MHKKNMQLPVIKTYHPHIALREHHFFILSKGNNAGKPLDQPCANCFIAYCSSHEDREFFYWLSYALWQAKIYYICLSGSVIPFIHINDVRHCLDRGCHTAMMEENSYRSAIIAMRKHQQLSRTMLKLMDTHKQLLQSRLRTLIQKTPR
jgi:hypothetical protein